MSRHRGWTLALGLALVPLLATTGRAQFDYPPPPPSRGGADLNAMVREMQERVQHLRRDIASDLGRTPEGRYLIRDADDLAASLDRMRRGLHGYPDPRQVQRAFDDVDAAWHHLQAMLERQPATLAVLRSASRVDQVDAQLHRALGLAAAPLPDPGPPRRRTVLRPRFDPAQVLLPMSDQLIGQVDAFLQAFAPNAEVVPQGAGFLADAQQLRAAAVGFDRALRDGAPPDRLSAHLQEVEAWWAQLAGRMERVARGRMGPNIRTALEIGDTTAALRQTLDDLAFPPVGPGPPPGVPYLRDHERGYR